MLLIGENNVKFYIPNIFLMRLLMHVYHPENNKVEDEGTGKLIHIPN